MHDIMLVHVNVFAWLSVDESIGMCKVTHECDTHIRYTAIFHTGNVELEKKKYYQQNKKLMK